VVSGIELMDVCGKCGYSGPRWQFEVHHRDLNRRNNVSENLVVLCIPCHRLEHGGRVSSERSVSRSAGWERLDAVVRVRVDPETKDLWVEAAGGSRRLSRWVRERCNAAVTEGAAAVADSSIVVQPVAGSAVGPGRDEDDRPAPSVTADNCPQRLLSHVPGTECPKCHTVFPPVAIVVEDRVFRGMDPKPGKR
jgi:hypothetical protein